MRPQSNYSKAELHPVKPEAGPQQRYCENGQKTALEPPPSELGRLARGTYRNSPAGHCDARYIGRRELRQLFPVSDMTIWRWQHDPQIAFPAPTRLSSNGRNYWWFPAIRDWEQRRRTVVDPSGRAP